MTIRAHDDAAHPRVRNDTPATWETGSVLGGVRGIQWWGAVLLALGFTGIGVFADLQRINRLGLIFQGCYFAGCVLAALWVQRRGLFGPMVQPPLILAMAVPGVVLASGGAGDGGLTAKALAVGTPLINGFPTMAITTAITVLIGLFRIAVERGPQRTSVPRTAAAGRRPGPDRRPPTDRQPDPDRRPPTDRQPEPDRWPPTDRRPSPPTDRRRQVR